MSGPVNAGSLVIVATVDTSRIQQEINAVLSRTTANLRVKLDTSGMIADLQRVQQIAGRAININVKVNGTAQAVNDVNTLKNLLAGLQGASTLRISTDVTALQAVNTTIATQISQLTALIAQLRGLGSGPGPGPAGGAGGLPAGVRATILEIERLNNLFTRGQISSQNYNQALTAMQGRLEGARAAAGRGTEEFAQIDRQITKLTTSLRGINTDSLTKVRTDMAGVRTAFDSATAGISRNSQQFRDAAAAYQQGAAGIEARLRAMAAQGNLTAQQMGNVNRMLGTLAREQGTLTGGLNPMGLSGNMFNALRAAFPIIQQMGGSLGAAAAQGGMLAQGFGSASAAAGVMGIAVLGAMAAVVGIGLAAMNTVKTFETFEHAMQGVKAVSDTTGKTFGDLKGQAMLLGREFGVTLETVAQAQEELYKAGRSTQDILGGAAKGVILLAAATGTDLLNAVNIANSAMNVFGLKGSDMVTVADTISNGANKTALDVNTLGVSLQQVGNVAASSGLSLQETVAVLGMMADKGMAGSDAGTSLKVMLQRLKAPTDAANSALKEHGVAVYDASGKQRNMMDILKDTIGSMNGMTDAQRNAFAQTVFGTDAVRAITVMYANGKVKLDEYVDSMSEKGTAERGAITRLDDLQGAQKKVNVSIQIFKTNIGEYFAPGMKDFLAELQKGVDGLNTFFNLLQNKPGPAFKDLAGWLKETGQSMVGLTESEQGRAKALLEKRNAIERELGISVKLTELNPMIDNAGKKAIIERLNKSAAEAVALVVAELAGIQKGASVAGRATTSSLFPALPGVPQGTADSSGLGLASGLGLSATRRGTPFGGTYFGNQIHNGEDFFAPTGTPLNAPFAGYVTTRTTKATGKIVELIDSVGNKLLLGHLDAFADGLEARIKAANGRLMLSKGETVGTVGQTGTLAHKDLGPGNAHVHAMGYMAGSNAPVSPFSVPFQGLPFAPPTVQAGAETGQQQARAKGLAAYVAEVTRLQAAIDKALSRGTPGMPDWQKATAALKNFTESNKDMVAEANEWISRQGKATKQALKEADKDAAQIRKSLAAGNVTDAQTSLEKLRTIQQAQLDDAGSSQARRLAVVKQTSGQIYAAELAIADATRRASMANLEGEKNPDVRRQAEATADKTYALAKQKAVLAQAQAMTAAQKSADSEASRNQLDAAKARADTLKALREDDVKAAQANLGKLKEVQDRALALDKYNLIKQLADKKTYAQQVHDLQVQINQAQYNQAVKDANNGRAQERPKLLSIAQTNLDAANMAAQNAQNATVAQATDAVTAAVQKQRDAYSKLADGLRQMEEAGTFSSAARQKALEEFNALGRATDALGLTNDKFIRGARAATFALVEQASAAYLTAQRTQGMVSGNDEAAASALQLATDLASLGDTQGQLTTLQATYDDLTASLSRGEASAASVDKVRLALEGLQDSLGTESAVNDWLATLDGGIDAQLEAITAKLADPSTTTAFKKQLQNVTQSFGTEAAVTSGPGEAGQQAVKDQTARNIGEARNLLHNLTEATGGTLQAVMVQAAALLASEVGRSLPAEIRQSIQEGIDGAAAGVKALNEVLANPGAYADGAQGLQTAPESPDVIIARQDKLFADTQSRTAAHLGIERQQLDRAHAEGLVSQAGYISQRQLLAEQAAGTEFETRTRGLKTSEPAYKAAEEALQAALTAADAEGVASRKTMQDTEASNFLMSAQRRLTLAQRDGRSTAGPRAEVATGLASSIALARTELSAMNPLADGYQAKLTTIQGLEDQLRDVRISATLVVNGFDTGIAAIGLMTSAAATLGQSLSSHFEKVAQGSESMSQAVSASVAEMTVSVIKNLEQQIIATEVAALATDLLSGNFVKAAIDVGIIAAVGIGGGLATGLLGGGSGSPTIQNPSGGTGGSAAASAASSAPAITYSLTMTNNFSITEGLDSPGTRQKLASMQEQSALRIMDRAGLIKLPAASPVAGV